MKAAIFNAYGATDVLDIADVPRPRCQVDEILVRVRAAAVNPKDTFIRKGRFKRLSGENFPMLTGFDFAGEIAEIGSAVTGLTVGEPVYGMLDGFQGATCAEYLAVKPFRLAHKPENLSYGEAAALPLVTLTALQALRDVARIQPGQHVCINGASGGVGVMAVQIAKRYGATVTAIGSQRNHDFLHGLGADHCLDYREQDITQSKERFDIFFDVFGNQPFRAIKPILTQRGVWVSTVIKSHVFRSVAFTKLFGRKKAKMVAVKANHDDLSLVREWVEASALKSIIHAVYPLDQIRAAHAQQETKHTQGKIVVQI